MSSEQHQHGQDVIHEAIARNEAWCKRVSEEHPDLFPKLGKGQSPQILWIGCSDSRVPETTLLDLKPGDVFVHRNIANVLHPGDLSSQSVIEFAVAYLKVNHIVLCGHTSCGGVNAALGNSRLGVIDTWLTPLRILREQFLGDLDACGSDQERTQKLVELNVKYGVKVLKQNHHVIDAMRDRGLKVHGLVYDVGSGKLTELETGESEEEVKRRVKAHEVH